MTTRIRTAYRIFAVLAIAALLVVAVRGELPVVGGGVGTTTQPAPGFVPHAPNTAEQAATNEPNSPESSASATTQPIANVTDAQVGAAITHGIDFLLANFDGYQVKHVDGETGEVDHAGLNGLCVYALLQAEQATRDRRLNLGDPFMKGVLEQLKHAHLETQLDKPQPVVFARAMRAAALAVNNRPQDHSVLADDVAWLIRAHRQGAYTDDDNFGTPTTYTEPPPPPSSGIGMGMAIGQTTGIASGPRGMAPAHTTAAPDHFQAVPSHTPGFSPPPPGQAAGNSRPSLAPSQRPNLDPSKRPNLDPSKRPNLDPSGLPNLNPSRFRPHLDSHDICIPMGRGNFLHAGGPSTSPSTRPWDLGEPGDPLHRNRSRQDVIMIDRYGGYGGSGQLPPGMNSQEAVDNVPFAWDSANSQFGLLGVSAGADVGLQVPSLYWQAVQYHWLQVETEYGTWSYDDKTCEPSIGPTWAGDWSLLVTHDWLGMGQRADQLGGRPYHPGLVQAFKWLMEGNHSVTIKDDQTNFVGYNLFMLELVGQASGFKFFGSHDWYREVAAKVIPAQWPSGAFGRSPDGYDSIVQTAYTVLFLASGRHPIFMEKLGFNGAWANRPRDIANLARFASRELEHKLNWEVVTLDRNWTDWLDSPVLYIASHEEPPVGQEDFKKLRSYVQAGGVLFTHADGRSKVFNDLVEKTLAPALFPQYPMQDIPETDPIYSVQYKINPSMMKLRGVSNGSRWLLVHSPVDLSYSWQTRGEKEARRNFELGVNLFVYAAGKTTLHNRLDTPVISPITQTPSNTTRVVQLSYDGNWNPEPYAWQRADRWMRTNADLGLDLQASQIAALHPGGAKLAVLTGTAEFAPTDADIESLKAFVSAGGWLLIDDCGGTGKFAASVEHQLLPKLSNDKPQLISIADPVVAGEMMTPKFREGTTDRPGASFRLQCINLGKGRIIYSPTDITTGLLGANTFGILGYQPASAMALARNVVSQSAQRPAVAFELFQSMIMRMTPLLNALIKSFAIVAAWELLLGFTFQLVAKASTTFADRCARAPIVDLLVAMVTWVPWVWGCLFARWIGLAGAVLGQMAGLYLWCFLHEMLHRDAARGPRIVKFLNRTVGRWQNHVALWVTLIALPGFWMVRLMEIACYWPLVVLLGFPKYRQSEWINVSRQKFSGLVGHDLVWCLYCDWMTGVYSLGAEMLRNVESFWCPIRFYEGKKCENCQVDFPDLTNGWAPADATMADVVSTLEQNYSDGHREWFGHPARLTVKGKPIETVPIGANP